MKEGYNQEDKILNVLCPEKSLVEVQLSNQPLPVLARVIPIK